MTAEARPYEPLAMTTQQWRAVPVRRVRIAHLVFVQERVRIDALRRVVRGEPSWCGDRYPHVVEHDGRLFLADGHHRVSVAICRRKRFVRARVLRRGARDGEL